MTDLRLLNHCAWMILTSSLILTQSSDDLLMPSFLTEPESVIASIGSNVTIHCSATPDDVTVRWILNGSPVHLRDKNVQQTHSALQIAFRSVAYAGTYQCLASNRFGMIVSRSATLSKAVLRPQQEQLADREIVTVRGNVAMIPCAEADSDPPPRVQFAFNGSRLELASRHVILPSGNLQISDVSSLDEGIYRCLFFNPVTKEQLASHNTVHLKVKDPLEKIAPRFIWTPLTHIEVVSGGMLVLECVADGWPVPVVSWLKYEGHLPVGRYSQLLGNLIINNVQSSDEGTYICRAENIAGHPQANVAFVEILEAPQAVLLPSYVNASIGGTASLSCAVTGKPMPTIAWYHNGILLRSGPDIAIMNGSLVLLNIRKNAVGIYQCMASSVVGTVHSAAQLRIHGDERIATSPSRHRHRSRNNDFQSSLKKQLRDSMNFQNDQSKPREAHGKNKNAGKRQRETPRPTADMLPMQSLPFRELHVSDQTGKQRSHKDHTEAKLVPPTKPNVTKIGETSVMLQWSVPPNDGLMITFFKVQYKEITGNRRRTGWRTLDKDISAVQNSFKVDSGLKTGSTYQFRIVAVYSNLDNKHSPNSAKVTLGSSFRPRVPQYGPVVVRVGSTSQSTISVEWQFMLSDRFPIEGFYVYYKPYESEVPYMRQTVLGSDVRATLLTGLDSDTLYSIRMQCFNTFGQSDFSNTAVILTLTDTGLVKLKSSTSSYDIAPGVELQPWVPEDAEDSNAGSPKKLSTYSYHGTTANLISHVESRQRAMNNDTLYVVLGAVLGTMLIVFIVSLAACVLKHCQQRRIIELLESEGKYGKESGNGETCCSPHAFTYSTSKWADKPLGICQSCSKVISHHHLSSSFIERAFDEIRSSLSTITQTESTTERNGDGDDEFFSVDEQCLNNQSRHLLKLNVRKFQQFPSLEKSTGFADNAHSTGRSFTEENFSFGVSEPHQLSFSSQVAEDHECNSSGSRQQRTHHYRHFHHHHYDGNHKHPECHLHHHHHRHHHHHHNKVLHQEQQVHVKSLT